MTRQASVPSRATACTFLRASESGVAAPEREPILVAMGCCPTPEPPEAHSRRLLFSSLGVSVVDFRCRANVEPQGREEPNPTHSIVFVRRGTFERTHRGCALLVDPNYVLFFNQEQGYHYAHPVPGGDDCTILTLESTSALAAVARWQPRDAERPETPFQPGHALASVRAARLHFQLLGLLAGGPVPLAAEDLLVELVDEAVRAAYRERRPEAGEHSGPAARRRREAVEAAKLTLNERFEAPPRLAELAGELGCSPFHLSHVFRHVTGLSLRGYLGRLRVRLAADRLARGATSLTDLALDLGYADHSHFTHAFRKEWGVPPSRLRGLPGR